MISSQAVVAAGAPGADAGPADFARRTEPFRRELLAHSYRMLGSHEDAEDAVQETYLRAWRGYRGFEGRSSLRVWLYRIATNVALTAAAQRGRRALPSGLGGPADDPAAPVAAASGQAWLQPIPDAMVTPDSADPAAVVASRDSLRLALLASMQELSARQRAVFILREVLEFPATDVAAMLDTSVAAVKSALQRARARLAEVAAVGARIDEPADPRARALLEQYMAGFEHADLAALERALRADATIELVGSRTWFAGKATCLRFLAGVLSDAGDWRMRPTRANGQPAAVAYRRGPDGRHHAFGIGVLRVADSGIAGIVVFGDPEHVARFGFPATDPG